MALNLKGVSKWHAGRSGNPGGAPKRYLGPTLTELCQARTEECVNTLIVMMRTKSPNQLPATLAILDRGWGRPSQHIETTGDSHLTLHLLAAQMVQAINSDERLDAQQQERLPLVIDGDATPTE